MPAAEGDPHPRIGAALREERERQGLSIEDLEDRTKIRRRYLRALENEDWDILPGPTYVRGFMRTYAEALGLDAEELVDDYREEFEPPQARAGLPETVLSEHRGAEGRRAGFGRGWLIAALVVGLVALLLVLGLWGGSDDEGGDGKGRAGADQAKDDGKGDSGGEGDGAAAGNKPDTETEDVPDTVELDLSPRTDSEICLVNKGGAVLIDSQVLTPGDEEKFEADAFDLSLGFGEVELTVNGRKETVEASSDSPVTYQIVPSGLRQPVPDTDPDCP
jgi:transcriptional regulator with XRE-family HTH domain